jgi:hypothetical protein
MFIKKAVLKNEKTVYMSELSSDEITYKEEGTCFLLFELEGETKQYFATMNKNVNSWNVFDIAQLQQNGFTSCSHKFTPKAMRNLTFQLRAFIPAA